MIKCPICGWKNSCYLDYDCGFGNIYKDAICKGCNSHPRHRLIYLYIMMLQEKRNYKKVLHCSPKRCIKSVLMKNPKVNYTSIDLIKGRAIEQEDLTSLSFQNNTFDLIVCIHVLEHIKSDKLAIKEMQRVLCEGGDCLIDVPLDNKMEKTLEDPMISSDEEKEKYYWYKDHVRLYGNDFKARLIENKFDVNEVDIVKRYSSKDRKIMGLKEMTFWHCKKK